MLGRNTQGVRLIRLDEGERLIGVEAVEPETGEADETSERAPPDAGFRIRGAASRRYDPAPGGRVRYGAIRAATLRCNIPRESRSP